MNIKKNININVCFFLGGGGVSRTIATTDRISVAYAEFHDDSSFFTVHINIVIDAVDVFLEDGLDGIFQCRTSCIKFL